MLTLNYHFSKEKLEDGKMVQKWLFILSSVFLVTCNTEEPLEDT